MHFCVGGTYAENRYRRPPMPRRALLAILLVACIAGTGCGDGGTVAGQAPPTTTVTPELAKKPKAEGEIVVRGEASPGSHGPYELSGTYTARFEQYAPEDPNLDFAAQTPFTAHLDPHADSDAGARKAVPLFETAAHTGTATVRASGRLWIDVEFGDFPYVIRLTPKH
jgi:hypothetical protein